MGKQWQTIFGGSKITEDGDYSHEIKWCLLLGRKVMTNLDSMLKNRDITLPTKVRLVRRRQWQATPVFLPGISHRWRSLVGWSPWGCEESDTTERLHFHALEKEMATHSIVLGWRIPGMAEPGGLLSTGLHRVGHDWSNFAAAVRLVKAMFFPVVVYRCVSSTIKKAERWTVLLNCGFGEDSWESLGLQGDPASPS